MSHLSIDTLGTVVSPVGAQQSECKVNKQCKKKFILAGNGSIKFVIFPPSSTDWRVLLIGSLRSIPVQVGNQF